MALEICNQHPKLRVRQESLRRWFRAYLSRLQQPGAEVSILLTDDAAIRRLNRTHRGQDRATDILSFGMREHRRSGDPLPPRAEFLGDLAVSLDTVQRQARERGVSLEEELRFILVHGLLHLLGYDHARPVEAKRMFALHAALLKSQGLKRGTCGN
jgi:probable rRNA maturation factor